MGRRFCESWGQSEVSSDVKSIRFFWHPDLHSCVNCKFYSPGSHYDCHETIDELVKDKERANFCDYFSVAQIDAGAGNQGQSKSDQAKAAFAALFG